MHLCLHAKLCPPEYGMSFLANVVFKDGVSHGHGQPVHDFVYI